MSVDAILQAIRSLTPAERAELDSRLDADAEAAVPELSPEQEAELDRRIRVADANPAAGIPWEVVYEESLKRVRT